MEYKVKTAYYLSLDVFWVQPEIKHGLEVFMLYKNGKPFTAFMSEAGALQAMIRHLHPIPRQYVSKTFTLTYKGI